MIFQFAPDEKLYTGLSLTHGNAQAVTLSSALCIERFAPDAEGVYTETSG